MPHDPRLDNILRALLQPWRASTTSSDHSRLYASSSAILTTLTNPLNVTLLTTQILTSPAIWTSPDPVRAALRVFGTFQSATLGKMELEVRGEAGAMGLQEWIGAVVKGANRNVPRWKHLLLLGGVLSAIRDGKDGQSPQKGGGVAGGIGGGGNAYLVPRVTRKSLEDAFCRAVNLSVQEGGTGKGKDLESDVLSLVLSHSLPSLSQRAKMLIDYDALLPVVIRSIFWSPEGFQSGYFLSKIEHDVVLKDGLLSWPPKSNSLLELQRRLSRPLFTSMSTLAHLAATCVREAKSPGSIHVLLDRLNEFTGTLTAQWSMTRLSGVSQVDEPRLIDKESRRATMPVVLQILKMVLFTTVVVVGEVSSRLVREEVWKEGRKAVASKILHTLRGLYFITSRLGTQGFTSYNFVYMSSIDILEMHPDEAEKFTRSISPQKAGTIPPTLLSRTYDLYFLNTVEHLVPVLPTGIVHDLLVPACMPYLTASRDLNLRAQFEASHSVMLAIIAAAPPTSIVGASATTGEKKGAAEASNAIPSILPLYESIIFNSFPGGLSRRQFRLAFSTLVKVCECPPGGPLEGKTPGQGAAIMEIGYARAKEAPETPLVETAGDGIVTHVLAATAAANSATTVPTNDTTIKTTTTTTSTAITTHANPSPLHVTSVSPSSSSSSSVTSPMPKLSTLQVPYTEREICTLALIDSLPHLLPHNLSTWLTPVAQLASGACPGGVTDKGSQERLKRRLWEVLSGGELDVERAEVGVRWWSEGGRELLEGGETESEKLSHLDGAGAGREGTGDEGHEEVAEARHGKMGVEGERERGCGREEEGSTRTVEEDAQAHVQAVEDAPATPSTEDVAKRKPQSMSGQLLLAKL